MSKVEVKPPLVLTLSKRSKPFPLVRCKNLIEGEQNMKNIVKTTAYIIVMAVLVGAFVVMSLLMAKAQIPVRPF